jgi:hypothetical protein
MTFLPEREVFCHEIRQGLSKKFSLLDHFFGYLEEHRAISAPGA